MTTMMALERCKHFGVTDIRGMAYMPGPSDYIKGSGEATLYENSDFYNNIFPSLWGSGPEDNGREDLRRFKEQLGINFVHCYDWAAPVNQRDQDGTLLKLLTHLPFLDHCETLGMKATIPISNFTLLLLSQGKTDEARQNIQRIFDEIYPKETDQAPHLGAAGMWKVFNEFELWYDRDPKHVVDVMAWLAECEDSGDVADEHRLPVMVCTSFGTKDGIEGAGYMKDVWTEMQQRSSIGASDPLTYWNERIVFATNPQREGAAIQDYLETRLPAYWKANMIPVPPVMFTELGSSIPQTGSEQAQAEWLDAQIDASKPGGSDGMMLGACIFLNEERPWEDGPEESFGVMRFGPDTGWGKPKLNFDETTHFPVWDPKGWFWAKEGAYPVEQQVPKLNYQSVAKHWKP